ncbi:hypothetical protein [Pseudodesulfovibrio senegalensis]|uniref:Uncharacterized protein n=1 Tax=Pseudodesulfovibrio senegalensis TaxID=1721087 RepID=A0A6N6N3K7_9BACT|nr:hypothetical protein [Pseudodesulfovibrio senegalensis]KAB1442403.1 hypothetical protein F8A88_08140 [Pseudodesulfovibrio senegalensis]
MSGYTVKPLEAKPVFDFWQYAEMSGESRVDHELIEQFGPLWDEWIGHLKAYHLEDEDGHASFLLVYLEREVDDAVDKLWDESPANGLAYHNLAICMVMSAAGSLVPELGEGRCAPLPRAGEGVREAMKEKDVEWTDDNAINRKFAVFTPYPYNGGCEICIMSDTCPNSSVPRH